MRKTEQQDIHFLTANLSSSSILASGTAAGGWTGKLQSTLSH